MALKTENPKTKRQKPRGMGYILERRAIAISSLEVGFWLLEFPP
jgi:hypothetical protein